MLLPICFRLDISFAAFSWFHSFHLKMLFIWSCWIYVSSALVVKWITCDWYTWHHETSWFLLTPSFSIDSACRKRAVNLTIDNHVIVGCYNHHKCILVVKCLNQNHMGLWVCDLQVGYQSLIFVQHEIMWLWVLIYWFSLLEVRKCWSHDPGCCCHKYMLVAKWPHFDHVTFRMMWYL